jgi:hypothetical protein
MKRLVLQGRALALVTAARLLLGRRDTTWALQRLAKRTRSGARVPAEDALVAVQRAGRIAHAACLAQSIALTALLERGGAEAMLVLGCRRYEDRHWGAHAWVISEGTVLEPVPAGAHIELAQLEATNAWIPAPRG